MSQEEFDELNAALGAVAQQDVHLGRALYAIVAHLPGYNDAAQAKADAEAQARAEAEAEAAKAEEPAPEPAPAEQPVPPEEPAPPVEESKS